MKTILLVIIIFAILAESVIADTTHFVAGWDGSRFYPPDENHKIGLALSGGGARGLAQIGVLKAFEEEGLHIGAIAGTSIGGIVGGLYASGYNADSLEKIIVSIDFHSLFSNRPSRTSMFLTQRPEKEQYIISIRFDGLKPDIPKALTAGHKLTNLLSTLTLKAGYTSGRDFSKLKIPFRAVTTDIVTGREVILSHGNLADAMRATMAFPLAFTGVEKEDMILMDGGIVNPVPVEVIPHIESNLDLIVAVNTTSDLLPKNSIKNPIDIANQVTSIMSMDKMESVLKKAGIVITPDISEYLSTDFKAVNELIERGYQAGLRAVPQIRRKLATNNNHDSVYIANITFTETIPGFNPEQFPIKENQIIEKNSLKKITNRLFITGNYLSVSITAESYRKTILGYNICDLEISIIPKPDPYQSEIIVNGNTVFNDSAILELLRENTEQLSATDIRLFCNKLKILYENKGFDLAYIRNILYYPDENRIIIEIDEAIIKNIRLFGNKRTMNWVIKSGFPLKKGMPFKSHLATQGIANIYSTDLFDWVTMDIIPGRDGATINITVEEKKYLQLRLGWHWDNHYNSEQFIQILDDNLFGTRQELLAHCQYAERHQKYRLALKADRFFSTYLTYKARCYYQQLERKQYDNNGSVANSIREDRLGAGFILGRQISRFGTVTGEIRWEEIINQPWPAGSENSIKLRTITIRSLVETINRYPFPTKGKKHLFYLEQAAEILGGETKYTKGFSSVESYFPITGIFNFHPRLSLGWTETDSNIPKSEKFYLGGQYSFSGFLADELIGDNFILLNMELRYKLPYRFYFTGRYDIGNIFLSFSRIKFRDMRIGYGFSLAYNSPLGPIDIGYGKAGGHPDRFYINIGLAF